MLTQQVRQGYLQDEKVGPPNGKGCLPHHRTMMRYASEIQFAAGFVKMY